MTTSYMDYIRIMFTHRFFFKFAVNILQITTSSKGYVHVHAPGAHVQARVCERACAGLNIQLSLDGFSSNWMGTHYTCYMGYILIMFKHRVHACERACASERVRASVCERVRARA
jgi:hypothetical protein